MKSKYVLLASALFISVTTFAQKDELKTLRKIYEKTEPSVSDITDYNATLTKADALTTSTDADKSYFGYYKAVAPLVEILAKSGAKENPQVIAQLLNANTIEAIVNNRAGILNLEKAAGKEILTKSINETAASLKQTLVNYAIALHDKEQFKESAQILNSVYKLDPKDAEKLYYAANFAISAKDYDLALKNYIELKNVNYTGEATNYYAKSAISEKEDYFGNDANAKKDRDDKVRLKLYSEPRDEKIPSKKGEIVKNIALIYLQNGKKEEALAAIKEARATTPDDSSLMMTEANLYYEMKDIPNYQRVIKEAIDKNPNDAELYFNLGVTNTATNGVEAEKYFKKAIELNKDYTDAYLNLSELILRDDESFVKKMSKLGTSEKDTKAYEALKVEREKMFNKAMPFLEKAFELDPKNEAVSKTLLSVYKAMELSEKIKALKAKL